MRQLQISYVKKIYMKLKLITVNVNQKFLQTLSYVINNSVLSLEPAAPCSPQHQAAKAESEYQLKQMFTKQIILVQNIVLENFVLDLSVNFQTLQLVKKFELLSFQLKSQRLMLKSLMQEISAFYIAHMIEQMPKFGFFFQQLSNPYSLIKTIQKIRQITQTVHQHEAATKGKHFFIQEGCAFVHHVLSVPDKIVMSLRVS